jgi:hypothetical protein
MEDPLKIKSVLGIFAQRTTLMKILKSFYECIEKVGEEGLKVRRRS